MDARPLVPVPLVARPLRLRPFRALTLAPTRIGAPSSVRAFTRPYRDVPARLDRWERQGRLTRETTPATYVHEFTADGVTVRGLVGALDISRRATARDEVAVFPHEGIHPAQAEELAARMTEMQANPAPILLVHRGSRAARELMDRAQAGPAAHDFTDRGGQRHRVWAVRDPDELAALAAALAPTRALIADGHHRYAAYLRMQAGDPRPETGAGLAMLVDQDDTPLLLGPIHRFLGHTTVDELAAAASRIGAVVREPEAAAALAALAPDTVVATDGHRWLCLRLTMPPGRLAVEVVHEQLVPALTRPPTRTGYHHTVDDVLSAAAAGRGAALLLPAPDFRQVLATAAADRLLPEKATSFQPKPNVGVLIRSLRDG